VAPDANAQGIAAEPRGGLAWRNHFPNMLLTTHNGQRVRFYDDLIKGKVVVINFMYATCQGSCPLTTANLVKVRKALGERFGRDVFFYSITLMPEEDSPEVLKQFADRYKVDEMGPGWSFLTGRPRDIELLRRRLGFAYEDRKLDADRTNHIRLVLMGNEPYGWWGTAPGADMSANQITKLIEWLEPGTYGMQGPPEKGP
jgi:protein SCO1/2